MAKFNYYLKNAKSSGETAIYLSICSCDRRVKYYTGQSLNPKFWDQKKQQAFKVKHAPEFNTSLKTILTIAEQTANRLKAELKAEPTPEQIRTELESQFSNDVSPESETPRELIPYFEHFIKQAANRTNEITGRRITNGSIRSFKQTLNVINDYKSRKNKKLNFDSIDFDFYIDFKVFLENDRLLSNNTIGKHIRLLKTVLNDATQAGVNTNMKYKGPRFKAISEPANNIYLSESELMEIQGLDLSKNQRLDKVRDLFLIGCWTGLRFSDSNQLTQLNKKSIIKDSSGNFYFKVNTQKTGTEVIVPILPALMPIISKYGGIENLELPKSISNQKTNDFLKEIGKMVDCLNVPFTKQRTKAGFKINKNLMKWELLSTHTARRSFATNMFLRRNIPISLIMAITGHKTEPQFYKYIQMQPNEKAEMFRELFFQSNLKIAE